MNPQEQDALKLKQVIVMRRDLKMRQGKAIAQGAHAAMLFLLERLSHAGSVGAPVFSDLEREWMRGAMTKVCVRVDSEEALQDVIRRARQEGLVVHAVMDSGRTEFKGVPTLTCCAIGPAPAQRIDAITGSLGLL
jgi:PTH2 family peptidyl-tRNA hydrolase